MQGGFKMIFIPIWIVALVVILVAFKENPTLLIIAGILLFGSLVLLVRMIWGTEIKKNIENGFYRTRIEKFFKGGSYKTVLIVLLVIAGLVFLFYKFPVLLWVFPILAVIGLISELIQKINPKK